MQVTKLVVLGVIDILGKASGYDVFQYMEKNKIDRWTEIQKPSIYNAIKSLEKDNLILKVEELSSGRYPIKSIYTITKEGRVYFDDLQKEAFLGIFPKFYGFKIALKFNKRRSKDEISAFAIEAIEIIDKQIAAMDMHLKKLSHRSYEYKRDWFFIEHDRRLYLAEKEWIHEAVEFVRINI